MWNWDFCITDITAILVFLLTLCLVYFNIRRSPRVPPGPSLWPVIGNLPCLIGDPVNALECLRQKHGNIIGLYIGSELTVFVNGYEAIHEVLVERGTQFSWRPETPYIKRFIKKTSIVFANGKRWKENRQFTQTIFQKLCFNNQSLGIEEKITEELVFFIDKLGKLADPVDIASDIQLSFANVIFNVIHGYRPGYNDERFLWYLKKLKEAFKNFRNNQLLHDCLPLFLQFPFYLYGTLSENGKLHIRLQKYFHAYCLNNYDTYVEGQEDCLVHHIISSFGPRDKKAWENILSNEEEDVWVLLHDLMAAGSETGATTIIWILLYMIREPEVQKKARDEVDSVLGKTEIPSLKHRKYLNYVEAVILEGLRLGQIVPFGVPHSTAQDVTLRGYRIPKNTNILLNIPSVSRDPNIFPEPDVFKPERFLSEDGKVAVPQEFIPFSKGPRSCLGESLARIELFLYMTTLLQKFEFISPEYCSRPEATGIFGLTYAPKPYKLKLVPR